MGMLNRLLEFAAKSRGTMGWLALILVPVSLYMVFMYAPTEATMGHVQRIFYYHIGTAWNGFLFFGIVAVTSGIYLFSKDERWHMAALSAGELGVLFTTLTLLAGSLWARPIWNVWWTWDPRLTTTLILWFVYVAYLLIQSGAKESPRRRRLAAVVGILGFLDIPLIHFSAQLWRSIHPTVLRQEGGGAGMPPEMLMTMIVSVFALMFLGLCMWGHRFVLEQLRDRTEMLKDELVSAGGK